MVHDGLADPEVALEPFLGAGVFAESIWLHTGSGFSFSSDLVVLRGDETGGCGGEVGWVALEGMDGDIREAS